VNGLFGQVLETLGFDVHHVSGTVGRAEHGWRAQGNHLVLIVVLDRSWIVDVGFGDGFLTPLPLGLAPTRSPSFTTASRATLRAGAWTTTRRAAPTASTSR
jgi:N-hydroxyarylamine O-acetyltransferase